MNDLNLDPTGNDNNNNNNNDDDDNDDLPYQVRYRYPRQARAETYLTLAHRFLGLRWHEVYGALRDDRVRVLRGLDRASCGDGRGVFGYV